MRKARMSYDKASQIVTLSAELTGANVDRIVNTFARNSLALGPGVELRLIGSRVTIERRCRVTTPDGEDNALAAFEKKVSKLFDEPVLELVA